MSTQDRITNLTSSTATLNTANALTLLRLGFAYRPELDATLFGKMANEVLAQYTPVQVRAAPESILQEVLTCPAAWAYGRNIAQEFNLVAHFEEYADVLEQTQITILRKAAINDLERPGFALPGFLAGYELASRHNAGRSYNHIIADVEQHMLSSGQASSQQEAILAVFLLASHAHQDLLIKDIPQDLPYGVSLPWVNFKHGVNLSEASQPDSSRSMTFQALVELPSLRSAELTIDAEQEAFEESRLELILIWAVLNGLLRQPEQTAYSDEEIRSVIETFNKHEEQCLTALTALTIEPPDRRTMAKDQIRNAVASPAVAAVLQQEAQRSGWPIRPVGLYPHMRLVPRSYGHVYFKENPGDWLAPVAVSYQRYHPNDIRRPAYELVDLYMAGENIDNWRLPGSHWREGCSDLGQVETAMFKELPPITPLFEQHFAEYLSQAKSGYRFLIKHSLACLPLEHRIAIEYGDVQIYSLRTQTSGREAGEEIEKDKEPLWGRYGFILQTRHDSHIYYFEVFPSLVFARHRPDIHQLDIGGVYRTEKWRISRGSAVSVFVRRGTSLPFDWEAYRAGTTPKDDIHSTLIAEPIGAVFAAQTTTPPESDSIPPTMLSSRTQDIAQRVSAQLFYTNEKVLHETRVGKTSLDTEDPLIGFIKWITPWGAVEDLLSGDRDRIRQGAFSLFGFFLRYRSPVGKIASGSLRLITVAARKIFFKLALPKLNATRLERINRQIGYGLSGRGAPSALTRWSLDKQGARFKDGLTASSQRKWDAFQNAIHNEGRTPQMAANVAGGADLKRLAQIKVDGRDLGQYQIRLSGAERATFSVDYTNRVVKVLQVGGHTR